MDEHAEEEERSFWESRAVVLVVGCLSILALLGILVTALFIVDQRRYNDCQRQHNDEVIAALSERGKAGDADRQAIRQIAESTTTMIKVIINQQASPQDKLKAIQDWRDAQTEASDKLKSAADQRNANPIPEPRHC